VTTAALNGTAGRWTLSGDVDYGSVPVLWPTLQGLIAEQPRLSLSLADVAHANSAALVLLLEAREMAARVGCELTLTDLPADLVDLARMSQSEQLIAPKS
jgi:phospholipid transport system transporter-binding protein